MSMFDFLYKLSRKWLPASLYKCIQVGSLGRASSWNTVETYRDIYLRYKGRMSTPFKGKTVLELGPGNQLYTAIYFIIEGAHKVILVDPKLELTKEAFASSFKTIQEEYPSEIETTPEDIEKIKVFEDLSQLPMSCEGAVDLVFSNLVLEHINDLPGFFKGLSKLLSNDGLSYNFVDLTDHTYHVLSKFKVGKWLANKRRLFHLRYSDSLFSLINDQKCFMNRSLLPEYAEFAKINNLKMKVLDKTMSHRTRIHQNVLARQKECQPLDLYVSSFEVVLKKGNNGLSNA